MNQNWIIESSSLLRQEAVAQAESKSPSNGKTHMAMPLGHVAAPFLGGEHF